MTVEPATIVALDTNVTLTVRFYQPVHGRVLRDASLTNSAATTNLTNASNDTYNGDPLEWLEGSINAGEVTPVSDYVGASKLLSFGPMPLVPRGGDRFRILHLINLTGQTAKMRYTVGTDKKVRQVDLTVDATPTLGLATYVFKEGELSAGTLTGQIILVGSTDLETSSEKFSLTVAERFAEP